MWFLAIQQLLARKKQSLFVVLGILVGSAAYVTISGIMLGFQTYMIERLIDNDGHIRISAREDLIEPHSLDELFFGPDALVAWHKTPSGRRDRARIEYPAGWFALLNEDPRVIAYSPQLTVQALAQRGVISTAVRVIGVDPARHERVTRISQYMESGRSLRELGPSGNRLVVGVGLLRRLGASIGESILLSTATGAPQSFRIIDVFEFGTRAVDNIAIYASLADAQKLNGTPNQISDIGIRLSDVSMARSIALDFSKLATDKVLSWDQENQGMLSVFNLQTAIRLMMSLSIILVAAFGIYNILNMIVAQKKKEIGILRSMGYMGREVSLLFLYQGLVFGLTGGVLGLAVGYGLCRWIETFHVGVPETASYRNISMTYDWEIYAVAFALAFGSSVLAGWVPARAAGRLEPIDIIRSGDT